MEILYALFWIGIVVLFFVFSYGVGVLTLYFAYGKDWRKHKPFYKSKEARKRRKAAKVDVYECEVFIPMNGGKFFSRKSITVTANNEMSARENAYREYAKKSNSSKDIFSIGKITRLMNF